MPDRTASSAAAPGTSQLPESSWQLAAAVCLERLPVITPTLTPFQQKIQSYYDQLDLELSLKSDHELRHIADLEKEEKRKASGAKLEAGVRTALDDEDAWEAEHAAFTAPTSRSTPSDNESDLNRALDRPLHLLVNRAYEGGLVKWELPQIQFLGNAPWSFYKHYYSKAVQQKVGHAGEKVFIFKAFYQGGDLALNNKLCKGYKWLLREELTKSKMSRHEKKALFNILYDEYA